jgi:hypothetical protein
MFAIVFSREKCYLAIDIFKICPTFAELFCQKRHTKMFCEQQKSDFHSTFQVQKTNPG